VGSPSAWYNLCVLAADDDVRKMFISVMETGKRLTYVLRQIRFDMGAHGRMPGVRALQDASPDLYDALEGGRFSGEIIEAICGDEFLTETV